MGGKGKIIDRLNADLLGPSSEDEKFSSYPTDVYLTGILFPQRTGVAQEENDQLQSEGTKDVDSNDVANDEISLATVKRPASFGMSFVVGCDDVPSIEIHVAAGVYRLIEQPGEGLGKESDEKINLWERTPVELKVEKLVLDFSSSEPEVEKNEYNEALGIHVRTSPWGNRLLVTVAVVNNNSPGEDYERTSYEEMCFFQTHIEVQCVGGTQFYPRPLGASAIDEDTRMAQLIYRDVVEYAVGHTCSAAWVEQEGVVDAVETDWLPQATVKMMSSAGVEEFKSLSNQGSGSVLSTEWLANTHGEELVNGLETLPALYLQWLEKQENRIPGLEDNLREQAIKHIAQAQLITERMKQAIDLIKSDSDVQTAFRLANQAILLQRQWAESNKDVLIWRPFQLGFILLSLESLADETHEDRGTADLLWFPTGGGKTEAYLGLIAFVLFLRRLRYGDHGAGVASFMRYTLRLLTVQQFQRAAALICACDALRLGEGIPDDISFDGGDIPFSLGLWVGGDATPNRFDEAKKSLSDPSASSRPDQLKYCPRHQDKQLSWIADNNRKEIIAHCPDPGCLWHKDRHQLPVWTVDDDVYRQKPSLVIGTIDKFAQIARNPNTAFLFGADDQNRQPDLIIQDELHLISGPLGTLAGLYEVAIDRLCSREDVRPKIIASTATIRQASTQIKALFDRNTCLFPPPVIDATNSGFAVEDEDENDVGREYVGVTTAGRSAKFALQAVTASLMQSVASGEVDPGVKDDFWTLVAYFNSLRELGGALVLMQDDVMDSIDEYASRRDGEVAREINEPVELTSRVRSSEIKEILDQLKLVWNQDGSCDVVLASNMISVGVDVPRLGMMVVNGQPKGIAEYIQSTSRVGRRSDGPGGLVVTVYNNAKSRDRSHFETFRTWHAALYRSVEATSVTPFAPRAREKAIHAVLVILARHLVEQLRVKPSVVGHFESQLDEFIEYIHERADGIDKEEAGNVEDALQEFEERWIYSASDFEFYWNEWRRKKSLMISAEKAAELQAKYGGYNGQAKPTPNSMRNVEAATLYKLQEKLRERD